MKISKEEIKLLEKLPALYNELSETELETANICVANGLATFVVDALNVVHVRRTESGVSAVVSEKYDYEAKNLLDNDIHYIGGATSSHCPDFGQIPLESLIALAERFKLGEKKHGRGNWQNGINDRAYVIERANHVIYHAYKLINKLESLDTRGLREDDDAAAIMWGGAFLVVAINYWLENEKQGTIYDLEDSRRENGNIDGEFIKNGN